jgi:hypothetical protein
MLCEEIHQQIKKGRGLMAKRFRMIGIVLALFGIGFMGVGIFAYTQVQNGYGSLQAFSEAQNVELSYNEDGQLVDRGETAGAEAIMVLLTEDWKYPVVEADLDPADPLVNTATEYMYQMAAISYHTLNGTQTVVLTEDATFNDQVIEAGTYEFEVDGRYWTDFDRSNPIEAAAREQAWSGTAHGLIAELGVGTVTHSTLQLGLAFAGVLAGLGLVFLLIGGGIYWAGAAKVDAFEVRIRDEARDAQLV